MRQNFLGHKVAQFRPNLGPNCPVALKDDFWEKLTNFCLSTNGAPHHAKIFEEESL